MGQRGKDRGEVVVSWHRQGAGWVSSLPGYTGHVRHLSRSPQLVPSQETHEELCWRSDCFKKTLGLLFPLCLLPCEVSHLYPGWELPCLLPSPGSPLPTFYLLTRVISNYSFPRVPPLFTEPSEIPCLLMPNLSYGPCLQVPQIWPYDPNTLLFSGRTGESLTSAYTLSAILLKLWGAGITLYVALQP